MIFSSFSRRSTTAAIACLFALALVLSISSPAAAADCKNRGDLDARYCDDNGDLVADTPKEAGKWLDPDTLVFSYTPVEDPSVALFGVSSCGVSSDSVPDVPSSGGLASSFWGVSGGVVAFPPDTVSAGAVLFVSGGCSEGASESARADGDDVLSGSPSPNKGCAAIESAATVAPAGSAPPTPWVSAAAAAWISAWRSASAAACAASCL